MKNYKDYWRNKVGRLIMRLALRLGGVNYRRELLLDFAYWWFDDLHPADAHNLINKYDKHKSNNCS